MDDGTVTIELQGKTLADVVKKIVVAEVGPGTSKSITDLFAPSYKEGKMVITTVHLDRECLDNIRLDFGGGVVKKPNKDQHLYFVDDPKGELTGWRLTRLP